MAHPVATSHRGRRPSRRRERAAGRHRPGDSARPRPSHSRSAHRVRLPHGGARRARATSPSAHARLLPAQGVLVTRHEEDAVGLAKLVPAQRVVVATRPELATNGRDRPLARVVDVGKTPSVAPRAAVAARTRTPWDSSASNDLDQGRRHRERSQLASPASRASCIAATSPAASHLLPDRPSNGRCRPAPGIRSTRQNRIHSTCPTTEASREKSHRSVSIGVSTR